jgi:hypothetical protein
MQNIIDNHHQYSTKYLNRYLFDIDQLIHDNEYFQRRNEYKFKSGKYERMNYYMLTICHPKANFTKWFIHESNAFDNAPKHRDFLKLMLKRNELHCIIEYRLKNGLYKGTNDFDL